MEPALAELALDIAEKRMLLRNERAARKKAEAERDAALARVAELEAQSEVAPDRVS